MKLPLLLLVPLSLALLSFANPVALYPRQNATGASVGSPCASVSSLVNAQRATATPTVPAAVAYECIQSVPLNKTSALQLINDIKPYINWQSTVAYLKDPPSEYVEKVQPAWDVWAELDKIETKVRNDEYSGEYDFGWALYTLFQSAHDGHFVYVPDSIGGIFTWGRSVAIVSVSDDGKELPKPFVYTDILAASFPNSTYTPSAITEIDGVDFATYLENWSQFGSLQDRDALYNNVFYNLAQVQLGESGAATGTFSGGGRGRWVYPGAYTTLTFANGSTTTYENFARAQVSFRNVENGTSLADHYFYYDSGATASALTKAQGEAEVKVEADTTSTKRARSTPAPGYPEPVEFASDNSIAGYYIDDDEYSDIAVLALPSFTGSSISPKSFQNISTEFIAKAKKANKTKLIIDVSANGGGTILLGYDLFKQLFPSILPYGGTRFRAHEAFDLIGQKFSWISRDIPRTLDAVEGNLTTLDIVPAAFNYRTDVDIDYKPFESWPDKFCPHVYQDDNFTSIIRWNMSDPMNIINGGIQISGYEDRSNMTTQPFKAADIVIITDGYCASTCTIFSELMRQQGNVTTIAFGGRSQYGAMQAVGGVKGTNNFYWQDIKYWAREAYDLANDEEQVKWNQSFRENYNSYVPLNRAAYTSNLNVRDGIREGDETGTPLQFVYEEADCRIFYTAEMTLDVTAIWKAAADSKWGTISSCVAGTGSYEGEATADSGVRVKAAVVAKKGKVDPALADSLSLYTNPKKVKLGEGYMLP
ncbi:peptidase S41 family protein-like protein [Phyllosticta citrichinensis]